jgi:PAS domain S-box-containing protein
MMNTQTTRPEYKVIPSRSKQYALGIKKPLLVFMLFTLAITAGCFFVFQHYRDNIKIEKQDELGGIADLKIKQISNWMMERRGDAQSIRDDPLFTPAVDSWLQHGAPTGETRTKLALRLSSMQMAYAAYGYRSISLFDAQGMLRLSTSADETQLNAREKGRLLDSMHSGLIVLSDIHLQHLPTEERIDIQLRVPLTLIKHGQTHNIGAVLFRIDPTRFLFPLIQFWPTASPTAENLLVRRDGDDVLFLNKLRHRKNTALTLRIPLSQSQLPAAMAVMGKEGLVEGLDYRGVQVVGVLSKVPGTSWAMVSKMDKAEIYAPISQLTNWTVMLMLCLVGAGGGIGIFWRQKEIKQYEAELERQRLALHLDYLTKYANDIILLTSDTGEIIDFNDRALEAYGYSAEEFVSLNISDLLPIDFTRNLSAQLEDINRAGALRFESMHVRRNGASFPIEASVRVIDIDRKKFHQAIIRDISERRNAEIELRRQKSFMWQVIDTDPSRIFVKDINGIFLLVNQSTAAAHGLTPNEMVGRSLSEINKSTEEVEKYLAADRKVIEDGNDIRLTEPYTLPNGEQRWLLTFKKRLTMPDGKLCVLGISVDITHQKLFEIQLAESYKELQRLTLHLENVKADERAKIALNLHDEMGATLAALKMRVSWLASKLPAELTLLSAEAAQINELISGGIHTMHNIVNRLRPDMLGDVGLAAAIKDYVKKFMAHTNIECILDLPEEELTLNDEQSLSVFRIFQESLNNVVMHAQASKVNISFTIKGKTLLMEIRDNGIGFDQTIHKKHAIGLLGIRERALMVGGKAKVSSTPGKGACVSVAIPPPHA